MKKMRSKLIVVYLLTLFAFLLCATDVKAANTLGDLKQELQDLVNEKAAADASKRKTQDEINTENNKISSAHAAVEKAENDINLAKIKIEESNASIDETKAESEKTLNFYQLMNGENNFVQYISGADSITEMIMRADAVAQILDYNSTKLNQLQLLIEENQQLQVTLTKKQEELNAKIIEYEKSVSSLKSDLSSLVEVSLDIEDQIQAQKELIKYYEDIGCTDSQELVSCVDIANNSGWLRPTISGCISSGFGYRSFYLNGRPYSDFHNAVDVACNPRGTSLYSAASGQVAAVIYRANCGGNQVFIHTRVKGVAYTITYGHLLDVYVKVGDVVTQQSIIGTVGGGGETLRKNGGWDTCSTGYHLHFGIAKGFYLGGGAEGYSSYSTYVAKSIAPPFMPGYGARYYSRA